MRVGLVTPGFSASARDWCIPAQLDLVRALAATDDVRVFALRYPHERRTYDVCGAEVHAFGGGQRRGLQRPLLWGRALRSLLLAHRRRPFDVLHALWAHEPGLLATAAGRLTGTPLVVSLLGGELADISEIDYGGRRGPVNRRLVRLALRNAARATVGSRFLADLAERSGHGGARLRLWPLGVDVQRFSPGPPSPGAPALDGRPAVLCAGSLVPVKDHAMLLRAFVRVRSRLPEARLHLVGDGPERGGLEALARDLGIGDAVRFHGALAHELLPDVYRQADLFAVSSRFESQGMAVLEAAACGCLIAGTAVGVVPELTTDGVAPGDADALGEAIVRRLERSRGQPRARPAGFEDRYGLPAAVARLRAIYEEAMS
jgi:glycosyltransferase involved in cell wall biosynthesis